MEEQQKNIWIQEQFDIATKVIVVPDPEITVHSSSDNNQYDGRRFVEVTTDPFAVEDNNRTLIHNNHNCCLYYGGVDVSFPYTNNDADKDACGDNDISPAVAVYVVLEYPSMRIVYNSHQYFHLTVPYIPSFLAFREIEPIQYLIQQQMKTFPQYTPKAILVDGNGIFHPRRAGFACFVGVRCSIPTIGIGKTLFHESGITKDLVFDAIYNSMFHAAQFYTTTSQHQQLNGNSPSMLLLDRHIVQPNTNKNENDVMDQQRYDNDITGADFTRITLMKELSRICIGLAIPLRGEETGPILAYALVGQGGRVREKKNKPRDVGSQNPIYISVGHNISLHDAVIVCTSLCLTRIPEPVRQADLRGRELIRQKKYLVGSCLIPQNI
jgi:endonuclease V